MICPQQYALVSESIGERYGVQRRPAEPELQYLQRAMSALFTALERQETIVELIECDLQILVREAARHE